MSPIRTSWDALVIGGGPGGSTTAALLAQQGFTVLLAEKERFPRFHIGESLLPGSWPVWTKLGVAEAMQRSGQCVKQGAMFNLFGKREFFYGLAQEAPEFFPDNDGKLFTYQVVRSEYDQLLLDNARRLGAEVVQPCTVEQVCFDGAQATGAVLTLPGGERCEVSAKVVVDATGRTSLLARRLGIRHLDPSLNKIAYFTHYRGAYRPRPDQLPIWVLAYEGGWVWYISLKDDLTSVGVVLDAALARTRGQHSLDEFFQEQLRKVPYLDEWLANSEQVNDLHVISALSYLTDTYVGDGWLLVGDAATFVDPVFSSGVHIAMKGGDAAAQTIARAFATGDFSRAAFADYELAIRRPMEVIFPIIRRWYATLSSRGADETVDLFVAADRFKMVRRRLNATLAGAYEAVADVPYLRPVTPPERTTGAIATA